MKLSVKLLSGLTLIAFVAVAVIGLSHSASAAVDAKVYVTNKASGLTSEPSTAVVGRTSASTVYGTYASYASTGTTARDIVADSDRFIVTVIDADLNTTSTVTSKQSSGNGYRVDKHAGCACTGVDTEVTQVQGSGFMTAGDKVSLKLEDTKASPIIGSVGDISVVVAGTTRTVSGVSVDSIQYAGDGANAAYVTIKVDYSTYLQDRKYDIVYPTSKIDGVTVTIKSVVDPDGTAVLTLTETGRNTSRFEGEVVVRERTTALTDGLAGDGKTSNTAAVIPALAGPITVTYIDALTSGAATNVSRTASYSLDSTVPTATISSPTTAFESQSRLPSFTGTVTDMESGIDVSTFALHIDNTTDQANGAIVIGATKSRSGTLPGDTPTLPSIIGKIASIDMSAKTDGINSLPFSYTETVVLPNSGVNNPDHIVDFQARVADLAGNYGYSDSDTATGNFKDTGRFGNQPHTIKIDQIIPQISSVETGKSWDTSVTPAAEKPDVNTSLVVKFDGKIKESSVAVTDFKVTLSGSGGVFVPGSVTVQDEDVYLDIGTAIPSDNKPTVTIQGTVQDLAGNSTDAGSLAALDKLSPVLTVVRSGGSGTGTGTEAADSLTKANMTLTITSDEDLNSAPRVYVTDITSTGAAVSSVGNVINGDYAVAAGGNTWTLVVGLSGSSDGSRAVRVTGTDTSTNAGTTGKDTVKAYVVDATLSAPVSTPAGSGTTTQSNPFLTTDYSGDAHGITITSATLDTVDVTADLVASANSKTFFYQPTTALTNAEHTYVVKAIDAAGTTRTTTTVFTKTDRVSFVLELFAGWNSVSFPSDPVDGAIDSALSNSGITQVVAYDATTPSQPWRIASKVDDTFTSQTEPALSSITAGPGYWVESANFEDQTVALSGPTSPGDARPGLTTIPTGNGWNLVGVVDQSRSQTQAANKGATLTRPNAAGAAVNVDNDSYFLGVNDGRAYTFDTVTSKFREQLGGDDLTIGTGIWVFISPQSNGQLPHIVP